MDLLEIDEEDLIMIRLHKLRTINELLYAQHVEIVEVSDLIELELSTGIVSNSYVCQKAALHGNLEIVKHIHSHGAPLDGEVSYNACESGNVSLLQFLHENKCTWHIESISQAVYSNKVEAVKYLYSIGLTYKGDRDLIYMAIGRVNLDMLVFLRTKGHSILQYHILAAINIYDEDTALKTLSYLHTQYTELRSGHYRSAITKGNRKIMLWLYDKGCPTEYCETEDSFINKFQHDIGDLACEENCLYCYVDRMKEVMRLLYVEVGYGSWLSNNLIGSLTDQLI
jgi:hypothetical protein